VDEPSWQRNLVSAPSKDRTCDLGFRKTNNTRGVVFPYDSRTVQVSGGSLGLCDAIAASASEGLVKPELAPGLAKRRERLPRPRARFIGAAAATVARSCGPIGMSRWWCAFGVTSMQRVAVRVRVWSDLLMGPANAKTQR
jgi:hypothetical protein